MRMLPPTLFCASHYRSHLGPSNGQSFSHLKNPMNPLRSNGTKRQKVVENYMLVQLSQLLYLYSPTIAT